MSTHIRKLVSQRSDPLNMHIAAGVLGILALTISVWERSHAVQTLAVIPIILRIFASGARNRILGNPPDPVESGRMMPVSDQPLAERLLDLTRLAREAQESLEPHRSYHRHLCCYEIKWNGVYFAGELIAFIHGAPLLVRMNFLTEIAAQALGLGLSYTLARQSLIIEKAASQTEMSRGGDADANPRKDRAD